VLDVPVPADPTPFTLEIDLVSEGICWFAQNGSVTSRLSRPGIDAR